MSVVGKECQNPSPCQVVKLYREVTCLTWSLLEGSHASNVTAKVQ